MTTPPPGAVPPGAGSGPLAPRLPRRLLAALLVFALAEVVVLVQFAARAGTGWTLAVLGGSGLLGLVLLSRLRSRPGSRGFDLLCGLLLLLPGLLSSLLGLVLLVPAVRRAVRARWLQWAREQGLVGGAGPRTVIVMEPLESHDEPLDDTDNTNTDNDGRGDGGPLAG